ncbi:MAG TPA: pitrilysin family protein [Bacillota bacterium]|nr:pitrilysin family protein [Bacillota bacterium]
MKYTRLPSGMQIISEAIPHVRTVSMGIWVRSGTFSELPDEAGLSHFLEHMFFKGSQSRSARDIVEAFDNIGGELNAYTAKEYTCFYAKVIDEHLPLAVDVIVDMLCRPAFAVEDIEKEKQVILEEISMYEDSPDEIIHDYLAQTIWPEHPLGRPVIGSRVSIAGMSHKAVNQYYARHYRPDNIVVSAAGNLDHETLVELICKHADFPHPDASLPLPHYPEINYQKNFVKRDKATEQSHICLGFPGLPWGHGDIYTMNVMNNIFGGGMSSRLFQAVREELGLAYSIYSYSSSYMPAGYYTIYAGLSAANVPRAFATIAEEISLLKASHVKAEELERAKQQVKGALIIGLESTSNRMSRMGRGLMLLGRVTPLDEIVSKIEAVDVEAVLDLAHRTFLPEQASLCLLGAQSEAIDAESMLLDALR